MIERKTSCKDMFINLSESSVAAETIGRARNVAYRHSTIALEFNVGDAADFLRGKFYLLVYPEHTSYKSTITSGLKGLWVIHTSRLTRAEVVLTP
jgi:hypothetical protein